MATFKTPASEYMSTPILVAAASMSARDADALIEEHSVSAIGVTDDSGAVVGVLSRTDLLNAASAESGETFRLPDVKVSALMTPDPFTVPADTPIDTVAREMLKRRIHRVFVEREGETIGIVSSRDLMRAVFDKRVNLPALEIATKSIIRVAPTDTLSLAIERLDVSNKHGLLVVEDGWPVGTFAQVDALAARARDPRTQVEEVMNLKVLVLPPTIPLHRAAGQALALGVRRILLVGDRIEGVVSTFDFARVVR